MKHELTVGQNVFVLPQCNAARRSTETIKSKVETIGKKYFTLENFRNRFSLENMEEATQYTSDYLVFTTEQELLDYKETPQLLTQAKAKLSGLTANQLREFLNNK